ncbi:MAG: reverse transcriptase domain-containing protein [Pseudolabrys sp.]
MGLRYRNLIGSIVSSATMRQAYRLTSRGKRLTAGYLGFKEYDALNLTELAAEMAAGSYRPGAPQDFYVFDPKRRLISALPFRDRVAQQALCLVIAPIFDRALLPRTFACRHGKGTHAGAIALQSDLRRLSRRWGKVYFLKTDFSAYFASIDRATLWRLIEAKISCRATLRLIEAILPRDGIGLPIGSLTSQIFANLYTGATLDRHLQQTLGEDYWYRYMDDIVVLGASSDHLRRVKASIEGYARAELGLRFSKWQVAPASRGVNFLGYRIWPTHKLLRKSSVIRARRKIAAYRAAGDDRRLRSFIAAWLGHARFADSGNLIRSLGLVTQSQANARLICCPWKEPTHWAAGSLERRACRSAAGRSAAASGCVGECRSHPFPENGEDRS